MGATANASLTVSPNMISSNLMTTRGPGHHSNGACNSQINHAVRTQRSANVDKERAQISFPSKLPTPIPNKYSIEAPFVAKPFQKEIGSGDTLYVPADRRPVLKNDTGGV